MIKTTRLITILSLTLIINVCLGQDLDRKMEFPDTDLYLTLVTDLHIHTVFSDGHVWPSIRIEEAVKDGLDAISLTEHIEYQPWAEDIPNPDRNRAFELATKYAKPHDLIIIHGSEITRDMPPGHANALFITDANKLIVDDPKAAYEEARKQGAFIFWNHPNWVRQEKSGIPALTPFHEELIQKDLLHGIEVVNDITFSQEAIQIAIDHDLTILGTSDIHGLIDYQYQIPNGGHRPVCLVFAKERTANSIKEALFAGRTITWFENILAGKLEIMQPFIEQCIVIKNKGLLGDSDILDIEITNESDARFYLKNSSKYDFHNAGDLIDLAPRSTKKIQVLTQRDIANMSPLTFDLINVVIGYKKHHQISFNLNE